MRNQVKFIDYQSSKILEHTSLKTAETRTLRRGFRHRRCGHLDKIECRMNNPAHLHQPLKVIHCHFQNERDSSHGKDSLCFHIVTLHSHFQLNHLNFPKHCHINMPSYFNLAYCNESLTFFLSSSFQIHFTLQNSFPRHLWERQVLICHRWELGSTQD